MTSHRVVQGLADEPEPSNSKGAERRGWPTSTTQDGRDALHGVEAKYVPISPVISVKPQPFSFPQRMRSRVLMMMMPQLRPRGKQGKSGKLCIADNHHSQPDHLATRGAIHVLRRARHVQGTRQYGFH